MIVSSQNVTPKSVVTMRDIAAKTGYSVATVKQCMRAKSSSRYRQSTVETIRSTASELGYDARMARAYRNRKNIPANPVFAARSDETEAMRKMRNSGCSNSEIAHRCGVDVMTVYNRIGRQPEEITAANLKLAGKVRSAKVKIKNAYANQKLVASYNAKMEALNAEMAKVKRLAEEVETMRKSAAKASKATGTPLLRLVS